MYRRQETQADRPKSLASWKPRCAHSGLTKNLSNIRAVAKVIILRCDASCDSSVRMIDTGDPVTHLLYSIEMYRGFTSWESWGHLGTILHHPTAICAAFSNERRRPRSSIRYAEGAGGFDDRQGWVKAKRRPRKRLKKECDFNDFYCSLCLFSLSLVELFVCRRHFQVVPRHRLSDCRVFKCTRNIINEY